VSQAQILVVDDCKEWRRTLRSLLEAIPDYQIVGEAGDGVEAVEKAAQLLPDIVLLDIGMPILNGIKVAPRIVRTSPNSKILFVTQESDSDVRTAALATGAKGYLLKSRVVPELIPAIDALLMSRVPQQVSNLRAGAHDTNTVLYH
jgi:DNA-binding NarL/FixJ family response regulator